MSRPGPGRVVARVGAALLLLGAAGTASAGKLDRSRDAAKDKARGATREGSDDDHDDGADACGSCLGTACEIGVDVLEAPPADEAGGALPDDALPKAGPPPDPPPWVIEEGGPVVPPADEGPSPYRVDPAPARESAARPAEGGPTLALAGAWILAEEPLIGVRGRFDVPLAESFGLFGGWEGLHERTAGGWDALGIPSLGVALGGREGDVEGRLRLQGEALWLGDGAWIFGGAIGLEGAVRATGPLWLRVEAGNGFFPGFLSPHWGAGLGVGDTIQGRAGWRWRWFEGVYQGPELGVAFTF